MYIATQRYARNSEVSTGPPRNSTLSVVRTTVLYNGVVEFVALVADRLPNSPVYRVECRSGQFNRVCWVDNLICVEEPGGIGRPRQSTIDLTSDPQRSLAMSSAHEYVSGGIQVGVEESDDEA